jgi:uncharacterized protein YggE
MPFRAIALLLLISSAAPASAEQPPPEPVMEIKGTARIDVKPDRAHFDATVSTKGRSLAEAGAAHEERATRALSVLKGLAADGVEITQSSFRLKQDLPPRPAYIGAQEQPLPAKPTEPHFTAETIFSLKAQRIETLNAVISKLASSGLFELHNVLYQVDQERSALNQARKAAMLDAREQAEAYAESGGLRLVEIVRVTDSQAVPEISQGEADLPLPRFVEIIPPATIAFQASVNVVWRIAPR